ESCADPPAGGPVARPEQLRDPVAGSGGAPHPGPGARAVRGADRRSRPVSKEATIEDRAGGLTAIDPGELAHRIVDLASDKKAVDIVLLRTTEVTTMAASSPTCTVP